MKIKTNPTKNGNTAASTNGADFDGLLRLSFCAKALAISVAMLRSMIEAGRVKCTKLGPKTNRIRASELQRLIRQGTA